MALRKEPHRRYISAEQFSEDIERYLNGQPVIARLDTPGYQLAKYVRRNGEGVAAAIVIGAALISIAAVSQRTANDAVADRIVEDRTLEQTRHELVAAYLKAGVASRAVDVARIAYAANPGDVAARRDFAVAATALGDELLGRADRAGAIARYSEALTHYAAVAQMNTRDASAQRDVMLAAQRLGDLQAQDGNLPGALSSFQRVLQIAQTLAALEGEQISQTTKEELAGANRRVTEI